MTDAPARPDALPDHPEPPPPPSEGPVVAPTDWKVWVRYVGTGVYLGALAFYLIKYGIPFDREQVILWVMAGLLVGTFGREKAWRVFTDWLPFMLLMVAYDYTRGWAHSLGLSIHYTPQIEVDKFLFFGHVPTVWLQERLAQPHPHWWQVAVTLCYSSHFIAPFVVAGVLWFRNRKSFVAFACRFLTLAYAGLLTYILFPAAPPWIAGSSFANSLRDGHDPYIGPVHRVVQQGWDLIGLHRASTLFDKGSKTFNLYAAVPSLHVAFATLISVFLWKRASWWWKPLLAIYPFLMGFSLVFGGEHYVSDILLGWIYVALVMLVWNRIDRWRAARKGETVAELTGAPEKSSAVAPPEASDAGELDDVLATDPTSESTPEVLVDRGEAMGA